MLVLSPPQVNPFPNMYIYTYIFLKTFAREKNRFASIDKKRSLLTGLSPILSFGAQLRTLLLASSLFRDQGNYAKSYCSMMCNRGRLHMTEVKSRTASFALSRAHRLTSYPR